MSKKGRKLSKRYGEKISNKAQGIIKNFIRNHILEQPLLVLTLKTHLYVEGQMESILRTSFSHSDKLLKNASFARKIDLLEALAVTSDESTGRLRALNDIRNKYSHDIDFEPKEKDVKYLIKGTNIQKSLPSDKKLRQGAMHLVGFITAVKYIYQATPFLSYCIDNPEKIKSDPLFEVEEVLPKDVLTIYSDFLNSMVAAGDKEN